MVRSIPNGSAQDLRTRLDALVAGHDRRCRVDDVWLHLFDPRMPALDHGWKLHVSARPEDFPQTLDLLVPVLLRYPCLAKFAAGTAVLEELNAGVRDPAVVGKAVTVYPREQDVAALGRELADVLAGRGGPRVLSDRRVRPDAPVYYRYGPFRALGSSAAELVMTGPDGQRFPGRAGIRYRQPPWAADPFGAPAPAPGRPARLVGGRYRLTTGIARSPHGDVYRALDTTTGERVVVKQARAYAGEDGDGVDARGRLRHERAVLATLADLDGVPRVLDHLRHGEDEYLVTTDCGPEDLRRDVHAHGPYPGDALPGRRVTALARRLLAVLDGMHARGVVMLDLKPANVVLDTDGTCRLVDFGISALGPHRPTGGTPGYTLTTGSTDDPPDPADDLYALGATLHYALTGMDPVIVDPDPAVDRDRTLACLAAALPGAAHRPVRALVAGLLDLDRARRIDCARRLRAGLPEPPRGRRLPTPPRITARLLDDVITHAVADCVRAAADLPAGSGPRPGSTLALYAGAAGVGLELLHHLDRPGVPKAVAESARRTAAHPESGALSGALYTGRTGVELFLRGAAVLPGGDVPLLPAFPSEPLPYDHTGDQIGGAAGAGTGHLLLARQAHRAGRVEQVAKHLAAANACAKALLDRCHDPEHAELDLPPASSRAAYAHGYAHGSAGIVHFLHALTVLHARRDADPDPALALAAREGLDRLAAETPGLLASATRPGAARHFGSWCRGLAGIGTVLIAAGSPAREPELLELGLRCARLCHALAPRMSLVSQCCGLSGVGELLVDAALATGDDEYWRAAENVVALILARSGGTVRRPLFPDNTLAGADPGWATGGAGVLSLLRRVRDRGGERLVAPPHSL
ncbi:class IV lanthionine synthetase LanL [Embleya scabrispora]|uniref:class IV lanthionine synthetase LanL n=1 Tax=Embleya scabrispora TaxID=159449 RepID=UPI0005934C14|nr:class IV lanthionine synthetase LanL [Embleya scabrispora]MYS83964.1 serine/threonine protein kinase [Streptomyces sp. SID5474]